METASGEFVVAAETLGPNGSIPPMLVRTDDPGNLRRCHRYEISEHPLGPAEFRDVAETRLGDGRSTFHLAG